MITIKESGFRIIGKTLQSILPTVLENMMKYVSTIKSEVMDPIEKLAQEDTSGIYPLSRALSGSYGSLTIYSDAVRSDFNKIRRKIYRFDDPDNIKTTMMLLEEILWSWMKIKGKVATNHKAQKDNPEVYKILLDFENNYEKGFFDSLAKAARSDGNIKQVMSSVKYVKFFP